MDYYEEIKSKLIDNEIYSKVKDYSKEKHKVITYFEIGKLLNEAGNKYGENIIGAFQRHREGHVVKDAHPLIVAVLLEDHRDMAVLLEGLSVHQHVTTLDIHKASNDLKDAGLSTARATHDGNHLAFSFKVWNA